MRPHCIGKTQTAAISWIFFQPVAKLMAKRPIPLRKHSLTADLQAITTFAEKELYDEKPIQTDWLIIARMGSL
jgi:hypothetical protein